MGHVAIVEGLIGAGKSTLTQELGVALGPTTLTQMEPDEKDGGNPYLADFYGDIPRWAFTMQIHLLGARYRMQLAAQWHAMANIGDSVLDRSYFGDTCFARMMHRTGQISDREMDSYQVIYKGMTASVLLPAVCVRLFVRPEIAARRIQARLEEREGRACESVIDLDYLRLLDAEIDTMVNVLGQQGVRIIEVPWNENLTTVDARSQIIQDLADTIKAHSASDLFLKHHRRIAS